MKTLVIGDIHSCFNGLQAHRNVGAGLRRQITFENSCHAWLRTIDNRGEDPPFPAGSNAGRLRQE